MSDGYYAALASEAVERLRVFGVEVKKNGRLGRYEKLFVKQWKSGEVVPPDDERFPAFLEGIREVQVLHFITDQICTHPASAYGKTLPDRELLMEKFRVVMGGTPLDGHKGRSSARAVQWELYVAAISIKAGLFPVLLIPEAHDGKRPDLTVLIEGETYSIEAKRLSSPKRKMFDENLEGAIEQIENLDHAGFAVFDMSLSVNPGNKNFITEMGDQASSQARWQDFVGQVRGDWAEKRMSKHPRIMGLVICETQKWQNNNKEFEARGHWAFIPNDRFAGLMPNALDRAIQGRWMNGIPNRTMMENTSPVIRRLFGA